MSKALLQMVEDTRAAIKMAAYGGDIEGWVCDEVFAERTGLKTEAQQYNFRKNHPDLVRANKKGSKFIYNLPGYFELFK